MDKVITRNCAKFIIKKLDLRGISEVLVSRIRDLDCYAESRNVMIYYPRSCELNFISLTRDKSKNFYLPKIEGNDIFPCSWRIGEQLKLQGKYRVLEPLSDFIAPEEIDLVILPGLCADKSRCRLGYGGGFYDRFLAQSTAKTIFPVADELLFGTIPSDEWDKKVDIVLTPTQIIR